MLVSVFCDEMFIWYEVVVLLGWFDGVIVEMVLMGWVKMVVKVCV